MKKIYPLLFVTVLGTEFLFAQNVGIGTANPLSKLHVAAGTNTYDIQTRVDGRIWSKSPDAGIWFGENINDKAGFLGINPGTNPTVKTFTSFYSVALNQWVVNIDNSNGFVGIGQIEPTERLHLHSTTTGAQVLGRFSTATAVGTTFGFANTGLNFYMNNTDGGGFQWWTSGTERVRITGVGNVGIGTASPGTLLHVAGAHTTSQIRLTLPAANNGGGTGEVNLQSWVSEPCVTWDGAGIGVNVNNDYLGGGGCVGGNPMNKLNSGLGQAFIRFETNGGNMAFYTLSNSASVGTLTSRERVRITADGNVGINVTNPDDRLDVAGNGHINGFLKVGNPTAPPTQTLNMIRVLDINPNNGFGGMVTQLVCGSTQWGLITSNTNKNYFNYNPPASRTFSRFLTQWFWVPSGATAPYIDMYFSSSTENTWDGVLLQYTTDGTTFTTLTPGGGTAYATTAGTNPATCTTNWSVGAWTGTISNGRSTFLPAASAFAGRWVRFALAGMSDASTSAGDFRLYGLSMDCVPPSGLLNGTFQNGSVYAEKNVYAGSNVLMGDLAEYFKIEGIVEPGDLVSLVPGKTDTYTKTAQKGDVNVIGIVSTAPTLTLNKPDGAPVALSGRVPVKVTSENGTIVAGDFLTASSTPGYAMKATGNAYVIGKAVESFDGDKGSIMCLVQNGWVNATPAVSNNPQSSGSFFIPKGASSVKVIDNNSTDKSKVFVSLLANAGSNYWLSKKENGFFEVTFAEPVKQDVAFDYFVENARSEREMVSVAANKEAEKFERGGKVYEEVKMIPVPIATADDLKVPPVPADPSKFYIYTNGRAVEVTKDTWSNTPEQNTNKR